jgi:mannitol-1-phosphate/altronate dehydrogenase
MGQVMAPNSGLGPGLGRERNADDEPSVSRDMQAHQLKRLRAEHQKEVIQDAERLVQLAAIFKEDVEKGDKASNEALKNVDEIGKLAKRVSERIKNQ